MARYRCPSCLVVTRFASPRFAYCPRCGQPLASFDLLPVWREVQRPAPISGATPGGPVTPTRPSAQPGF